MSQVHLRACVMGHPVAHSRSPMLHGHWLRSLGINGSYKRADISPADFPQFFRSLRHHGYVGGNITIPHKAMAFDLVDRRDGAAESIGAVNTVWFEGDDLVGGNTDAPGYLASLDDTAPGWDAHQGLAVVLGAGGAARAIVYALRARQFSVALVNRTRKRAEELAARFGEGVTVHEAAELKDLLTEAMLLTNATSLSGLGRPALEVDLSPLRAGATVCDLNYVPLETELLSKAAHRGNRTVDGLGMLMHQAVPGFAKWFGVVPKVTQELRTLLEADIRATSATK